MWLQYFQEMPKWIKLLMFCHRQINIIIAPNEFFVCLLWKLPNFGTVWSLFMLRTQWNRQEQLEKILCKKCLGWYSWIFRVIKVAGWPLKMPCWLSYVGSWPAAAAAGVTVKVRSVQSTEYSWHLASNLQPERLSETLQVYECDGQPSDGVDDQW